MLTRIHGAKVCSDDGFEVELANAGQDGMCLCYREGQQQLLLAACYEPSTSGGAIVRTLRIYLPFHISWQQPDGVISLSAEDGKRILTNIRRVFEYLQEPIEIVSGSGELQ